MVVLFKLAFFAIFSKISLICLIAKFSPFQLLSYVELLIAKLRPPQMTAASQGESRAVTRERQIQINYNPLICDFFFRGRSHSVCKSVCYNTVLFFYHQDAVFERNLFYNGHKQ